ncbi:MAG: serine/threonine protein kinase [Bryobacterales bacterium]|nr:serine/threonine protein kinase [Bryobacterales bacterium]
MTAAQWQRLEGVFAGAVEVSGPERAAYIRQACEGDGELERQARALLAAHEESGDYLEGSPLDFRDEAFGQYQVEGEIGRGGMSVVYAGRRLGGDFQRKVAIKLLLGAPGPLAGETRILAGLEHTNIARLYDAGTTSRGFRYLVMEFVDGVRLDEWARGRSQDEVLRMFLQVCAGVQHAHRALVVHRDLKPANVLVTADGVAKLLDFGIARILSGGDADTTGVQAWTPDYASPEQVLGGAITTGTDVYSLGVMLCELLSGNRPRTFAGDSLEQMAERMRREEVTGKGLSGDLARVAEKALRQDPDERYESVAALAADVERYLDGYPVQARPYSRWHAAGKFLWRHRWASAGVGIGVLALAGLGGAALWQGYLARERFEQVRGLSRTMLFELYDGIAAVPGTLPARRILAERGLTYLDALARRAGSDVSLDREVAQGYLRLGTIEGGMGGANLGRTDAALERYAKARQILEGAYRQAPGDAAVRRELADALAMQASALTARNRAGEAVPVAQEAVRLTGKSQGPAWEEQHAKALRSLGIALQNRKGGQDESIPIWEQLIAVYGRRLEREPNALRQRDLAMAHRMLAYSLSLRGDWSGVEAHTRKAHALNLARRQAGDRSARPDVAYDLGSLAEVARRKGSQEEAIGYQQQQVAERRTMAAEEPANAQMQSGIAFALSSLSIDYGKARRFVEAVAVAREAIAVQRAVLARDPGYVHGISNLFAAQVVLAMGLAGAGESARSCEAASEARRLETGPLAGTRLVPDHVNWLKKKLPECGGSF